MVTLQKTLLVITIIGAINWGFIGFLDFNLVEAIFGIDSIMSKVIYSIVGLCGLINLGLLFMTVDEKKE